MLLARYWEPSRVRLFYGGTGDGPGGGVGSGGPGAGGASGTSGGGSGSGSGNGSAAAAMATEDTMGLMEMVETEKRVYRQCRVGRQQPQ